MRRFSEFDKRVVKQILNLADKSKDETFKLSDLAELLMPKSIILKVTRTKPDPFKEEFQIGMIVQLPSGDLFQERQRELSNFCHILNSIINYLAEEQYINIFSTMNRLDEWQVNNTGNENYKKYWFMNDENTYWFFVKIANEYKVNKSLKRLKNACFWFKNDIFQYISYFLSIIAIGISIFFAWQNSKKISTVNLSSSSIKELGNKIENVTKPSIKIPDSSKLKKGVPN